MSDLKILLRVTLFFLIWKVILTFLTFYGLGSLPNVVQPDSIFYGPSTNLEYWVRWANWDGGHYRSIAENGYLIIQTVFFPLYPLLIKGLMFLNLNSIQSGLLISNVATIFALFYFYKLLIIDYKNDFTERVLFTLIIFPTAFYFTALYNESLFLLLAVSSFYYIRKGNFLLGFILAGLSAVTRSVGIIVIFSVFLEYYLKTNQPISLKRFLDDKYYVALLITILFKIILEIISSSFYPSFNPIIIFINTLNYIFDYVLVTLGTLILLLKLLQNFDYKKILSLPTFYLILAFVPFILFILYQYLNFNNALNFIDLQKHWGRSLTFPWNPIKGYLDFLSNYHYLKVAITTQVTLELLITIIALAAFIRSIFTLRISYTAFLGLALLLPMTSGTLTSIHRYILIAFPLFIILASIKNKYIYFAWVYASILFSAVLSIMFINNYWVT